MRFPFYPNLLTGLIDCGTAGRTLSCSVILFNRPLNRKILPSNGTIGNEQHIREVRRIDHSQLAQDGLYVANRFDGADLRPDSHICPELGSYFRWHLLDLLYVQFAGDHL